MSLKAESYVSSPVSSVLPAAVRRECGSEAMIPVWAIGETRAMSERERKLTAAIYADVPGVVEHVRREGRLPRNIGRISSYERELGLRVLVKRRGVDIDLSPREKVVYDAIRGEADAPGGWVVLLGAR
jgi:hypothetical protein